MTRESTDPKDLFRLSFGDQFCFNESADECYTALLCFHADDSSGVTIVCLKGYVDMEEADISEGEEVYLSVRILPNKTMEMEILDEEDRQGLEQQFHLFMLLSAGIRVTIAEQPQPIVGDRWTMHVDGTHIACRKVLTQKYGEVGEYTAHLFIGSEEKGDDDIVNPYLVFLEELESEPLLYGPIDEDDREMLFDALMEAMGFSTKSEDVDDELEDDQLMC